MRGHVTRHERGTDAGPGVVDEQVDRSSRLLEPCRDPIDVGADGGFRARVRKLKQGANRFVLEGRSAGLTPWKVDISITRK